MIHILTIHWTNADWIDIQLKYIDEFINLPYKTYAFLNRIPNVNQHVDKFYYTSTEEITSHPVKLNLLADMACFNARSDDDILIFIDGDAFPITQLDKYIEDTLKQYPLLAVQRLENNGDVQPHPCFCATTVGFWKKIKGDWKKGSHPWLNSSGNKVRDVGGALLHKLNSGNIDWHKLNRSNKNKYKDQVMFGIYDDLIYHHGAGFRPPRIRADRVNVSKFRQKKLFFKKIKKIIPSKVAERYFHPLKNEIKKNQIKSEEMYQIIQNNFDFFKEL